MKARLKTPEALVDVFIWTAKNAKTEDCVAMETKPGLLPMDPPIVFGTVNSKRGQLIVNEGDYVLTFERDDKGMPDFDVKNPRDFAEQYELVGEGKTHETKSHEADRAIHKDAKDK